MSILMVNVLKFVLMGIRKKIKIVSLVIMVAKSATKLVVKSVKLLYCYNKINAYKNALNIFLKKKWNAYNVLLIV